MTRQVRNLDQIRSLLRQMDRSVDDARSRREGTPRAGAAGAAPSNGSQAPTGPARPATPTSGPLGPSGSNGQRFPNGNGSPNGGPHAQPPSSLGGMKPNGNGNHAAPAPNAPARLKAKPKRASGEEMGGMNDPLQDFQQRQAS